LALLFGLPLLTSLFPYYYYRYTTPVRSMQRLTKGGRATVSRRLFLFFQYTITFFIIILSLFFVKQLNYLLSMDVGYRTQAVIKAPFIPQRENYSDPDWEKRREVENRLKDEIKQKLDASPLLSGWISGSSPNSRNFGSEFRKPGGEFQTMTMLHSDEKWLKLFDIQLAEGRMWDPEQGDDFFSYKLIVSESALKLFEITDYREALLEPVQRIWWSTGREEEMKTNPPYRIVGVVKDFYTSHLSQPQHPIAMYYSTDGFYETIIASFTPGKEKEVIELMKKTHDETVGGEFTYSFVKDEVAAVYKDDKRVATIYSLFSLIAIVISSLGLFSMSLFDIRQQRKSIAIRKINGATTREMMSLLLRKYILLLSVSFVVAIPLSLLAIFRYLEDFAFKAPVSWWIFALALLITGGISLLTLIKQIHKASNSNPAETIKTE
jgi:hypothetical protein